MLEDSEEQKESQHSMDCHENKSTAYYLKNGTLKNSKDSVSS